MSTWDEDDVRDVQGRGPEYRELYGGRPPAVLGGVSYCDTCRLFHGADMACAVALAHVLAILAAPGDELFGDELEGVDRVTFLAVLRARGLSLEPIKLFGGDGWIVLRTLGDGVPLPLVDA